jgi:hypothetical protein
LESEPEINPKTRFRFGFNGKRKKAYPYGNTEVSSDEILDSLTKQAASQMGFGVEQTRGLDFLNETEEPTLFYEPAASMVKGFTPDSKRKMNRYAIILASTAGMIIIWLYSSGNGLVNSALLNFPQMTSLKSIFANPIQTGIVSVIALISAVWVKVRKKSSVLQLGA